MFVVTFIKKFPPGTCHTCRRIYPLCNKWTADETYLWSQDREATCDSDGELKDAFNLLFRTTGKCQQAMCERQEASGVSNIEAYFVTKIKIGQLEINNWLLDLDWVTKTIVQMEEEDAGRGRSSVQ